MTKYLLIETWNGEGYSDSTARIVETSLPNNYAKSVAQKCAGEDNDVFSSSYKQMVAWTYDIGGEDSGAVVIFPVPTNWVGVVLKPMINHFEVIDTEEHLNVYIDHITTQSEEYKDDQELFGTIHHAVMDEDIIVFIKEDLEKVAEKFKDEEYEYDHEGDGVEYEVWKSKVTGQQIKVPIEIIRDWDNIETIEQLN